MTISGTIEYKDMGTGTWVLVTASGETYELKDAPAELKQAGLKVKVEGQVRDDVMTFAMIGPVFEVHSFEAIAS
ncbi:MAG: hypothetical protein SVX43_11160 [Cyanobacteriota bacterium]|nr:hypothetical protein [Cyanobacteriota bacterium]